MKLLIVDDEELTRSGLISSINWRSLGIEEVLQADDGLNGLALARKEKPDIVLCDIRMPRMDGIHMVEKIQEFLPDTPAIFMSGYSDKEYLKAAIKLKAVNYVEKPLNPKEIEEAVQAAIEECNRNFRLRRNATLHSQETALRLALQLTYPYDQRKDIILRYLDELSLPLSETTPLCTVIVEMRGGVELSENRLSAFHDSFGMFLASYHLNMLSVNKHSQYQVYHLYGDALFERNLLSVCHYMRDYYLKLGECFLAAGDIVSGYSNAYHSYSSAVIRIQTGFFFDSGIILTPFQESVSRSFGPLPAISAFEDALDRKKAESAMEILDQYYACYHENASLLVNQVKDVYYVLFTALAHARQKFKLSSESREDESILAFLENCFTLKELHETIQKKTERLFHDLENFIPENTTIFLIKDYISKHYSNEGLSVKEISEQVFLSTSYVCTFFKNETGQTLNQYLTEYRMEKAKQLLADPRYKISDISSKVGYSDGNYFGKSFKKMVGLSPSEYREKMLS